ncbi:MAG: DUF1007 family protein [Alphaproteobacteria bacterium]|nr:DUF1007 family protein [Alphaproteobacteria bacterium]
MKQRFLASLLIAAAALVTPGPALAHPHVWLDSITTFVFEGDKLTALRLTWSFDEFFGTAIIRRFDENRNDRFEPAENAKLEAGAFTALKDYGYFLHLTAGGKPVAIERVSGFQASIRNKQLIYEFTAQLGAPIDPAAAELKLGIYDETYFVEVSLDPSDPVRFSGMAPGRCAFAIRDGDIGLSTFGVNPPQSVTLTCRPAP